MSQQNNNDNIISKTFAFSLHNVKFMSKVGNSERPIENWKHNFQFFFLTIHKTLWDLNDLKCWRILYNFVGGIKTYARTNHLRNGGEGGLFILYSLFHGKITRKKTTTLKSTSNLWWLLTHQFLFYYLSRWTSIDVVKLWHIQEPLSALRSYLCVWLWCQSKIHQLYVYVCLCVVCVC